MKKIFSLILCILLLLSCTVYAAAEEEIIPITDREDLEAIARNPQGHYRLDSDIDLRGREWVPIPFQGTLDGGNHTIYNMTVRQTGSEVATTVDGNAKTYDTVFAGLFSVVRSAEISNLNILGAHVSVESSENCFTAILAGYIEDTKIAHCSVDGHAALYSKNIHGGVGGIAGFGYGDIENCRSTVELVYADRGSHDQSHRVEQFMGGLIASGYGNLIGNQVEIQGFDSCWGYVHNGGLTGMFYRYGDRPFCKITGNSVEGRITFFENNDDRRAYCDAFCGETLPQSFVPFGNYRDFQRNELYNQQEEIQPHSCDSPNIVDTPVRHSDDSWGFTFHQCLNCDYSWKTDYVAPGHIMGNWRTVTEPTYDEDGKKERPCTICGKAMMEKTVPKLIPVSKCVLPCNTLDLHYKDSKALWVTVEPENASDPTVLYTSSDESVATVDSYGRVTGAGRGSCQITCTSQDGQASAVCDVTVDYSFPQWLIVILLFGWIWY